MRDLRKAEDMSEQSPRFPTPPQAGARRWPWWLAGVAAVGLLLVALWPRSPEAPTPEPIRSRPAADAPRAAPAPAPLDPRAQRLDIMELQEGYESRDEVEQKLAQRLQILGRQLEEVRLTGLRIADRTPNPPALDFHLRSLARSYERLEELFSELRHSTPDPRFWRTVEELLPRFRVLEHEVAQTEQHLAVYAAHEGPLVSDGTTPQAPAPPPPQGR